MKKLIVLIIILALVLGVLIAASYFKGDEASKGDISAESSAQSTDSSAVSEYSEPTVPIIESDDVSHEASRAETSSEAETESDVSSETSDTQSTERVYEIKSIGDYLCLVINGEIDSQWHYLQWSYIGRSDVKLFGKKTDNKWYFVMNDGSTVPADTSPVVIHTLGSVTVTVRPDFYGTGDDMKLSETYMYVYELVKDGKVIKSSYREPAYTSKYVIFNPIELFVGELADRTVCAMAYDGNGQMVSNDYSKLYTNAYSNYIIAYDEFYVEDDNGKEVIEGVSYSIKTTYTVLDGNLKELLVSDQDLCFADDGKITDKSGKTYFD